jgi:hypothetical protein
VRDTQGAPVELLLFPGHIVGHPRAPGLVVGAGALTLRFDGAATVSLTGLAGRTLTSDADGAALAAAIEQAIHAAAAANLAIGLDGKPVGEAQKAELAQATVRWDAASRRFAFTSGRRGVVEAPRRSAVEVRPSPASMASDLGIADAASIEGRTQRRELRPPRAMLFDVRLDTWAASQPELASVVDDLTRRFPGRGSLLTAPSLLADDRKDGDSTLRLLPEGEPIGRRGWALFEAADSLRDRVFGAVFTPIGGVDLTPQRLRFDATNKAVRATISATPLVPSPLDEAHPAPRGMALAIGFALGADLPAGGAAQLASLDFQGLPALRLEVVSSPPNGSTQIEIVATATFQSGASVTGPAESRWRMPTSRLRSRVTLHASVVASKGAIELFLDGEPAPDGSIRTTAVGTPRAGRDMTLTLGDADGSPVAIDVGFAHLFSEPQGPTDPRLRGSVVRAPQWPAGRRIQLASTSDGIEPTKARFSTTIVAVEGDTLRVDPPIAGVWERGRTIAYADEYFLLQGDVRRKDDLLNHLYRASGEYRVSALLDDDRAEDAPVQVVETIEIEASAQAPTTADSGLVVSVRAGA